MPPLRRIVIAGGGSAGWMAAAALAALAGRRWQLTLVESDEIGIVGVGEATIPLIRDFNRAIGLDEAEFLRATGGSFKLGIEFRDWARVGDRYVHGFGPLGPDTGLVPFHHHWLKRHAQGQAGPLDDYSINAVAARANRFAPAAQALRGSARADLAHAFHFDAGRYAALLRRHAEARGVQRLEGRIAGATTRAADGHVDALVLADGTHIEGDLFLDCTGFRSLLLGQVLGVPFEDWSHWLPCDRAWAVPCAGVAPLVPYTRATARPAGWQWRIPLQHRTGNGHVFCSAFMAEDEAARLLLAHLDAPALAEPRLLKFTTGKRARLWERNVVALGLASGFMEPLESTSIHLVQQTITRLIDWLPDLGFRAEDRDEFNRLTQRDFEAIRDFLVLHYHATERDDSAFWRHCRTMAVPEALARRLALWRGHGRIFREGGELFAEPSWIQVLVGQRVLPQGCHPLVQALPDAVSAQLLAQVRERLATEVAALPLQADYLAAAGLLAA